MKADLSDPAAGQLLTLFHVAELLAKSPRGVRRDVAEGRFGPDLVRLGRSVRIRAVELAEWVAAGCPAREIWLSMRDDGEL